jgi:protein-S-isoprenylcysteine O-methyltransferase Ste14
MLDFSIAGPVVGLFAAVDVFLHLYLDLKKARAGPGRIFREPSSEVPLVAMAAVTFSTLLAFLLVLILPIAWLVQSGESVVSFLYLFYYDQPAIVWGAGLIVLLCGITLHGWARYVRKDMATSWEMPEKQKLITTGPYSRVRHPSYTSYYLCFTGLFMMVPSVVTCLLFVGIWGYYAVAKTEEESLLDHFGSAYSQYMKRTGRFFPKLR